jgi:hypothetical protein
MAHGKEDTNFDCTKFMPCKGLTKLCKSKTKNAVTHSQAKEIVKIEIHLSNVVPLIHTT